MTSVSTLFDRLLATPRRAALLAFLGSAALVLGALAFQHLGGYPPCQLCHWQRWAHAVALGFAGLALLPIMPEHLRGPLVALAATALLATAAVGGFHVGVEYKWWPGPASCGDGALSGLSLEDLRKRIMGQRVVRCDEAAWSFLGVSMAGWNMLLSGALSVLVFCGAWRSIGRPAGAAGR